MPRLDKTGPESKGPRTGRGMGDCNSKKNTGDGGRWTGLFFRRRQRRRGTWNQNRHQVNEESD